MTHFEIFHGIVADDRDADLVAPPEKSGKQPAAKSAVTEQDFTAHPITLIYFPLIPNVEYQKEFNPALDPFCSTFNFEIKEEQVELLAGLGEKNFGKGLEDVRKVLKETWQRKKQQRLEREKQEKKNRKNVHPAPVTESGSDRK